MATGTTRTTRITPLGRMYLELHPKIDRSWATPSVVEYRPPTPIHAEVPPLRITNQAICPHRFEVSAESAAQ
jgi:hypothetical protein